ncbi:YggT family protein [Cohaesibacter sp. ES.047]|uniref:YggT family protein n=1 Tax=Cohaesibacter sp. ES.047 TaxID=1798205 RepID=UPI000BB87CA4|nr:YggT family protein [Cohaesibacter sp. ES.047]SNY90576.1 YggT family protein [Cohaesibacter sp. ES.047]
MTALILLIDQVLAIYTYIVIATAVFSWLFAFNIVNPRNQIVSTIYEVCWRLTEPILSRIRGIIPVMGGLDLSPIVLLLAIFFVRNLLRTGIY